MKITLNDGLMHLQANFKDAKPIIRSMVFERGGMVAPG